MREWPRQISMFIVSSEPLKRDFVDFTSSTRLAKVKQMKRKVDDCYTYNHRQQFAVSDESDEDSMSYNCKAAEIDAVSFMKINL
jgi:hypothetical protein